MNKPELPERARKGLQDVIAQRMTCEEWVGEFGHALISNVASMDIRQRELAEHLLRSSRSLSAAGKIMSMAKDWLIDTGHHIDDFRKSTSVKRDDEKPPGVTATRWRTACKFADLVESSLSRFSLRITDQFSTLASPPVQKKWTDIKKLLKLISEHAKERRVQLNETQPKATSNTAGESLDKLIKEVFEAMPVIEEGEEN